MIKYTVIEEKRMVVAEINGCKDDLINSMLKQGLYDFLNEAELKNKYRAVSICHPDDEFDIEAGKRIAKERVIKKYEASRAKKAKKIKEKTEKSILEKLDKIRNFS